MRFVHADGWFADLPNGTDTRGLDHISIVTDDGVTDDDAPIVMRGIVVARKGGWNVVSCHGLYVSGPCDQPVGTHVRARIGRMSNETIKQ